MSTYIIYNNIYRIIRTRQWFSKIKPNSRRSRPKRRAREDRLKDYERIILK